MRRLKIGIRPQLIILVTFSSLFSLLILAIVIGVYYSTNLTNSRADRLEMISELKTTQVQQSFNYLVYQVEWLTRRSTIYNSLISNRAGNDSSEVFSDARTAIDQFLSSSDIFASARLYDVQLDTVVEKNNSDVKVANNVLDFLYVLKKGATVPSVLFEGNSSSTMSYISGPVSNSSGTNNEYFMGVTLPIYANSSIILDNPTISGYLTVIVKAENIKYSISNAISSKNQHSDYYVICVKPIYKGDDMTGFEAVFPLAKHGLQANKFYELNSTSAIQVALEEGEGSAYNVKDLDANTVAISFNEVNIDSFTSWSVIVAQKKTVYLAPVIKLRNIIIGVVFGIGILMCLITFPLTVWFIRPITKLKEATESITKSKKKKYSNIEKVPNTNEQTFEKDKTNNRDSIASTSSWSSALSSGIRLPSRIPKSKKLFKDELTELSDAFNIMTEELDKQYTHLEDRVKSRTKELEASKIEAEAANEAKTIFIANISHELRTPLNGILGMTSIAMAEDDNSKIQDSLNLIHRSGELLLHILTELLTYSKNTLNRSKLEISNFQVLEIAYQVKSIFGKLASDQRVNFRIFLKPRIIRKLVLLGDSNRIIQVVMNLVSNSLKFTPVDGSVEVNFKILGEYDYEKSKETDFKQVFIKESSRPQPISSTKGDILTNENSSRNATNERSRSLSLQDNKRNSKLFKTNTENGFNLTPDVTKADEILGTSDDDISVITLSTTQYENRIFESQFKKKAPASISEISRSSSTHSKFKKYFYEKDAKSTEANSASSLKGDSTFIKSDSDEGSSKEIAIQSPNGIISAEGNAKEDSANTDFKNSTIVGSDVEDSKSELVKDNKVYPIRTFYHPKTWVLQIDVKDTGSGIEPALQEKVFEPFIQGDQSLSRSYGGTGLGLSICRQLATMMRGNLTLKSTIGVGSTFSFTVPLQQTGEVVVGDEDLSQFCEDEFNVNSRMNRKVSFKMHHSSGDTSECTSQKYPNGDAHTASGNENEISGSNGNAQVPHNSSTVINVQDMSSKDDESDNRVSVSTTKANDKSEKPVLFTRSSTGTALKSSEKLDIHHTMLDQLNNINILVAEDNLVNQEVARRMLQQEGFKNITMACNGAEAIEFVKESISNETHFDLVFMDVQMPKVDGLLATRMIRQNLQYEKPIIALTAFADESNMKDCLESGMSGFLSKPIRRNSLKKVISQFGPVILKDVVTTPTPDDHDEKQIGVSSPR